MQGLILAFVFTTISLLTYIVLAPTGEQAILKHRLRGIRRHTSVQSSVQREELAAPFGERVLKPLLDRLYGGVIRWTPVGLRNKARVRLVYAGQPMDTARFLAMRVLVASAILSFYGLMFLAVRPGPSRAPSFIFLALGSTGIGYLLPEFWLSRLISRRKKALEKALPDVLDLLCVSVEAGLGFDGAVQKVSEKFAEPTAGEFTAYLKEIRLGKPRSEALRNLAVRTNLPDMQSFTAAIIQADHLGVSISKVLRIQSDQMRLKRRQRAEERAMQTPIKMLFPLIFFIFPTIFIVLLGPAVITFMKVLVKR